MRNYNIQWTHLDQIFCLTEGQRVAVVFICTSELLLEEPGAWEVKQLQASCCQLVESHLQVVLGLSTEALHQDDAVGDRCHPGISCLLVVSNLRCHPSVCLLS